MGRLLEFRQSPPARLRGNLWRELLDGTIAWGEPSDEELAEAKRRRRQIMEDSAIPWIVNDIGGLLQFFEDAQDIIAFTRWNGRILNPKRIARCMRRQTQQGRSGKAALLRCLCISPKASRKRNMVGAMDRRMSAGGLAAAAALKLFPGSAPIMWLLLAGQVSYMATGYGLRLGPIVGTALELLARGFAELGLPFTPEHNKYQQLKRYRLLKRADKGVGALKYVGWEDRVSAIVALRLALRDIATPDERVIFPGQYPQLRDVLRDPFETFSSIANLSASLLPNTMAYLVNDFFDPIIEDLSRIIGGNGEEPAKSLTGEDKAALRLADRSTCPAGGNCISLVGDEIALEAWSKAGNLRNQEFDPQDGFADAWLGRALEDPGRFGF